MTSHCIHNQVRNTLAIVCFAATGLMAGMLWVQAARLTEADVRVQQILDNTPNALLICNLDQEIIYVNPRAAEVTGYTLKELQAGGVLLLVPDEWKEEHDRQMQKAIAMYRDGGRDLPKVHVSKVLAVRCKDGKLLRVTVTAVAIAHNDEVEFFAWIAPLPEDDLTGDLPQKQFKPASK